VKCVSCEGLSRLEAICFVVVEEQRLDLKQRLIVELGQLVELQRCRLGSRR
jgi:hypothetical protein